MWHKRGDFSDLQHLTLQDKTLGLGKQQFQGD